MAEADAEIEATIGVACLRCDHEFEAALSRLMASGRVLCPKCGNACDPFGGSAAADLVVDDEPNTPPVRSSIAGTCAGCRKDIDIVPAQMVGRVALCASCREAISGHLGRGSGKSTTPFQPPKPLLAEARRSTAPPGNRPGPAKR